MDCIPIRPAKGAKISIVSRAFSICLAGDIAFMVRILCRRSASFTKITRTSWAIAIKSLRMFSASLVSLDVSCICVSFVTPSTRSAISGENFSAMSFLVERVSSIVSCKSAVMIVESSSFCCARIIATSTGCEKYGSPERRNWPSCFCFPYS